MKIFKIYTIAETKSAVTYTTDVSYLLDTYGDGYVVIEHHYNTDEYDVSKLSNFDDTSKQISLTGYKQLELLLLAGSGNFILSFHERRVLSGINCHCHRWLTTDMKLAFKIKMIE